MVGLIADSYKARKSAGEHPGLDIAKLSSRFGRSVPMFKHLLCLSYLSSSIIDAIIAGEQPSDLTSGKLHHIGNLPAEQQDMLGL